MNMIESEGSLNERPQCDYREKKTLLIFSSITPTCLFTNYIYLAMKYDILSHFINLMDKKADGWALCEV